MQSQTHTTQHPLLPDDDDDHHIDTMLPVPEMSTTATPADPIYRLAEVLVGMNSRSSAQTLMARSVSTPTLIFDGKSKKFVFFEDFFHTMMKMQPEMSEAMNSNHFHSVLQKIARQIFCNINSANRKTLEDILADIRRNYVKPESQATARRKWHKLISKHHEIAGFLRGT